MHTSLSQNVRASTINKYILGGQFNASGKNNDGNKVFTWKIVDKDDLNMKFIGVSYIISEMFNNVSFNICDDSIILTIINKK